MPVLKATYGFMAVECEAGENEIVFKYKTPGLMIGAIITGAGIALFVIYVIINKKKKNKPTYKFFSEDYYETEIAATVPTPAVTAAISDTLEQTENDESMSKDSVQVKTDEVTSDD
ncbi:MAG: hypothetical protein RR246_06240, partial [Clostridia bacterium]